MISVKDMGDLLKSRTKLCVICNGPARGFNFGALTCDACKTFFRRTFQKNMQKSYRCVNGNDCVIDIDGRKSCSHCRLQRCLQAGMDMSKAKTSQREKLVDLPSDSKRKVSSGSEEESTSSPLPDDIMEYLQYRQIAGLTSWNKPTMDDKSKIFSMIDIFDLDTLWGKYSHLFYNIPIRDHFDNDPYNCSAASFSIISAIAQRLYIFSNSLTQFVDLMDTDRKLIFADACSELCLMNSILTYNAEQGLWLAPPNHLTKFYKNVPPLRTETLASILGRDLHDKRFKLALDILRFHPDEMIVMLLFTILLFSPGRPGIEQVDKVKSGQRFFVVLLRKYLHWRYGTSHGDDVLKGLTEALKDFRRIGKGIYEKLHAPVYTHPDNSYLGLSNRQIT